MTAFDPDSDTPTHSRWSHHVGVRAFEVFAEKRTPVRGNLGDPPGRTALP